MAEHYEQVIATDVSEAQLKCATPHPRVKYLHTPLSLPDDEIVRLIGGEGSVDLVTVALAVHWFDLPTFYPLVTRLLRKPGGVFVVWGYHIPTVSPTIDPLMKRFLHTTLPFWNEKIQLSFDGYKTLPFPFESVGLGCEGQPVSLDIPKKISCDRFLRMLRSWSSVVTAKDQGIDLLSEEVVKEFETAWGGPQVIASVTYKGFMLAGKVKL